MPRPKQVGDKKVSFQTLMFTATLVPEVHQIVLKFASRHELVDLNRDMAPNKNRCLYLSLLSFFFFFLFFFLKYSCYFYF